MEKAAFKFKLDGTPQYCKRYGSGHINMTYLVETDTDKRYILQKINTNVFPDVEGLMENAISVARFVETRVGDPRKSIRFIETFDGNSFYRDEKNECWRVCEFVEGGLCLELPETQEDFYESAVAFGTFMEQMRDFPIESLKETIKDFHNTINRYRLFKEAVDRDSVGRAKGVKREIEFILEREEEAGMLHKLRLSGELPLRVTHNDTKLNNVMMDKTNRKALCVIDLDTVMPGLSLYDFGDSIRFGAATALEDERDLSKMEMSLDMFRTYTRGFVKACPSLTRLEREMLPMGAKIMTLECGMRFLTDYLDGDKYFTVHREGHNLDRARTQLKLVQDMEDKWQRMNEIVKEEALI